jgi:hypothetical protein
LCALFAFFAKYRVLKPEKLLRHESGKLQKALNDTGTMRGIIPICSHCKQIRDHEGLWKKMEEDIHVHWDARFSHGICPTCLKEFYPEQYAKVRIPPR